MNSSIIEKLKTCAENDDSYEAYLFTNVGEPEPLCAIYKAVGLARILSMHHSNKLKKHSMKFMLDHLKLFAVPLEDEEKKYFRNFNSHAELNGL
jgi:molybdopterin-guanine dinucleotide biosynthesis protein A